MSQQSTITRIYNDMVGLYHHLFPTMDLEFVVKSRKKPIMDKRHIIRCKLKKFYKCNNADIIKAENRITGEELDHTSMINSLDKFEELEEKSRKNDSLRKDIQDVDAFIKFMHSPHHQFLKGTIGDTSGMTLADVLQARTKDELVVMCEKLESYGIVRRPWFEAALEHAISENEAEPETTASDE